MLESWLQSQITKKYANSLGRARYRGPRWIRTEDSAQREDTILIQIGFRYELNYPFAANNVAYQQQIFQYIPQGLAFGLDLSVEQVMMQSLRPYDTTRDLGYIKTLTLAYIPYNKVDQLQLQLSSPTSKLYNNPDPTVKQLFSFVNPNLPGLPQSS
ncbi:MAG: hypothetical protein Q9171_003166 [Xanthocarpia ochracea]